jgi:mono/diheme cytochrome c family protein
MKNREITLGRGAAAALAILLGAAGSAAAADGRTVYQQANCVGCHKWHGDGGGGYGGAALSLRTTPLDRDGIVEVIRCGRPGTRMPYHDRAAYRADAPCYHGVTKAELGDGFPPKAASMLRPEQIEAVADYVMATLRGAGEPTYEDCLAYWGAGSRQCEAMRR